MRGFIHVAESGGVAPHSMQHRVLCRSNTLHASRGLQGSELPHAANSNECL